MNTEKTLRVGTRKSPLALWQAEFVASGLREAGFSVELVPITTVGDLLPGSLTQSSTVGLFTKEIQRALLERRCDIAVHSLKDLPTFPIEGLTLAAVPKREDPSDCMVSRKYRNLRDLPQGAHIGTGSPRRRAQLVRYRPDLQFADIRGNVETRLSKMVNGEYDAIILATAGLRRLGLEQEISERLPLDLILPAAGQAALGLETRSDDSQAIAAVRTLDDLESHRCVRCERALLHRLRAGCLAPVAAHAQTLNGYIAMRCIVFSNDYSRWLTAGEEIRLVESDALDHSASENLVERVFQQLESQDVSSLIGKQS